MFNNQTSLLASLQGLIPQRAIDILQATYHNCAAALLHRGPVTINTDGAKGVLPDTPVPQRAYDANADNVMSALSTQNHSSFSSTDANGNVLINNGLGLDVVGLARIGLGRPQGKGLKQANNVALIVNGDIMGDNLVQGPTGTPALIFFTVNRVYPGGFPYDYAQMQVTVDYAVPQTSLYGAPPYQIDAYAVDSQFWTAAPGDTGAAIWGETTIGGILTKVYTIVSMETKAIRIYNDSGETMPAHGLGRIVGYNYDTSHADYVPVNPDPGGETITPNNTYYIQKPDSSFQRMYVVNGPNDIAPGFFGSGYLLSDGVQRVLYDSGSGTPAAGQSWGAKNGQWSLSKGAVGFVATGARITTGPSGFIMPCQQYMASDVLGQTNGSLASGASGTIKVYAGTPGSETDTTQTLTAYNRSGVTIASGTFVTVIWNGGGFEIASVANSTASADSDGPDGGGPTIAVGSTVAYMPRLGKTDAAIAKGASGTVSVYNGSTAGSESDTGIDVTAYNAFANVAISKWVWLNHNGQNWYMTAAEC